MFIRYLRHSLCNKLDVDTCLTPEAKNLTELNYAFGVALGPTLKAQDRLGTQLLKTKDAVVQRSLFN